MTHFIRGLLSTISHLPLVLLGLCSTPKEDTGFSVSESVYGAALTISGELLVLSCLVLNSSARWKKLKQVFLFLCPIMLNIHPRLSFLLLSKIHDLFLFVRMPANLPLLLNNYLWNIGANFFACKLEPG